MSRDAMVSDLLKAQARNLKMPGLSRSFEMLGRQAREEKWSYEDYLHEVLSTEQSSRIDSAIRSRLRDARFPEAKTLDNFNFATAEGLDASLFVELARCEWVRKANNVLLVGPIGTGKTHLAIALGTEAAKQRFHVAFWRAADLVRTLVEARDKRELGRLERRLLRVDLLILDELGFVPFDRVGGEMLFNAIANRYERRSVLVTSNLAFSEWPRVFAGDEKLTTALLDRLADHATIVSTRGKSFRMRRRETDTSDKRSASGRSEGEVVSHEGGQGRSQSGDLDADPKAEHEVRASAPMKPGAPAHDNATKQRQELKKR
jgi:DNA replication protein DnaC